MKEHPEVGAVLTAESVKLLMPGDVLKVVNDDGWTGLALGDHVEFTRTTESLRSIIVCHSKNGFGHFPSRFAFVSRPDQSGDITDMVSRPSLEPIQLSGNTGELPATTELSRNPGQLKSLEPPASDVAGWRLVPVDEIERPYSDSLLPPEMIYAGMAALDQAETDMANYVPGETTDWDQGMMAVAVYRAMIAAAPPHPASKEVGDE